MNLRGALGKSGLYEVEFHSKNLKANKDIRYYLDEEKKIMNNYNRAGAPPTPIFINLETLDIACRGLQKFGIAKWIANQNREYQLYDVSVNMNLAIYSVKSGKLIKRINKIYSLSDVPLALKEDIKDGLRGDHCVSSIQSKVINTLEPLFYNLLYDINNAVL